MKINKYDIYEVSYKRIYLVALSDSHYVLVNVDTGEIHQSKEATEFLKSIQFTAVSDNNPLYWLIYEILKRKSN